MDPAAQKVEAELNASLEKRVSYKIITYSLYKSYYNVCFICSPIISLYEMLSKSSPIVQEPQNKMFLGVRNYGTNFFSSSKFHIESL